MTAKDDFERRIADHYAAEAPHRAPDRVLGTALATIDTTRQRRVLVPAPWRFATMNGFTRVAAIAVAVIALGAVGLAVLGTGSGPRNGPVATPSPSVSPTPTVAPTASPRPSSTPDPSPPPLGSTFTSSVNGISIAYPDGWVTRPATRSWAHADGFSYDSPALDVMHDPTLEADLFVGLASQPLRGTPGEQWVTTFLTDPQEGCGGPTVPVTIDGASGRMCDGLAAVSDGGRGYFIRAYTSGDQAWIGRTYDQAWFQGLLETVKLHPEAAGRSPAPSVRSSSSANPS